MSNTVTINLEGPDKQFYPISLKIPTKEVKFSALILPLYELFDKIIELELQGKSVTCSKGCGTCCSQLIPLSIPEAFFICDMLNSFPSKQKKIIKKKYYTALNHIMDANMLDDLHNPMKNKDLEIDYFNLGIECPFLEVNKCSIYKYRPFVCREFHVSSPKSFCNNPYKSKIEKIKIKWNIGALTAAFSNRLYDLNTGPIPLTMALKWVKKNKYLDKKKWAGTWIFQTIMDRLPMIDNEIRIFAWDFMKI